MKLRIGCVIVGLLSVALSMGPLTVAQKPAETGSRLPRLVRFGGTVKDLNGNPRTGVVGITFALYSEQTGGPALWLETQNVTADNNGHYAALLGSAKPDGLPADLFTSGQARWVGVQVSGQAEQPRVLLVSAPYALKAGDAETVGGLPASAFALASPATKSGTPAAASPATGNSQGKAGAAPGAAVTGSGTTNYVPLWTSSTNLGNSVIYQSGSQIGIGTTTPGAELGVKGTTIISGTGTSGILQVTNTATSGAASAIVATTHSPGANAIRGTTASTGTGAGVLGTTASTSGYGVEGNATATSGGAAGVYGTTAASNGEGVLGTATASTGNAVGVYGATASTGAGAGVEGNAMATTGDAFGVFGVTASAGGAGVEGVATTTTGNAVGVLGQSSSPGSPGVEGVATSTATNTAGVVGSGVIGVLGEVPSVPGLSAAGPGGEFIGYNISPGAGMAGLNGTDGVAGLGGNNDPGSELTAYGGTGVMGQGGNGVLVAGTDGSGGYFVSGNHSGGGDGINATNLGSGGYAGYFTGNVNVTGAIFAGTKDFKIDHPLDPAGKYLVHASVESSEMMNIYTGNVTTDGEGQAAVQLPKWFDVLNTDFRYQLTVIGQFAQAIVAREIENNRFEIRTSAPNVKVSWQVTGVRQDAYAQANPLVVEQEKEARLRGFYIHPELYGAPPEKQIEWARHPQMMKRMHETRAKQPAIRAAVQPVAAQGK